MKFSKCLTEIVAKYTTLLFLTVLICFSSTVSSADSKQQKSAIVLAAFGTTYDTAVVSLLAIKQTVEEAYPNTPVRFAFTSNIIRKKWHSRKNDMEYRKQHSEIPEDFYDVKNVLGTLADLQNEGYKDIVVQTTLLSHGEEYIDLQNYVSALASIETLKEKWRPFSNIALGRPLMGTWGNKYEYRFDLERLAESLQEDIKLAKKNGTALVYMGHGNDHLSTGLYYELDQLLNNMYPEVKSYVGLVEGHPNFDFILNKMKQDGVDSVTLKPLMVVAGDHATNDMAGDENDSWKVMLSNANIKVIAVLEGLGSKKAIQIIYLNHLKDAANDAGIFLN
ncbi:sirohydrochlorin cobaltochelatase [Vibrio algarum]|uniref:Sirohydrochlorin cobaltochelatase n=1 Tax=Vibrio algarum TaxID=3020714 RepID=A0ABT4YUW3_9VIBR|nr:sirohydrochlorin cobaltochelatase [Vibrio sp. KJ40-1]MDB1125245.1 sirohydrochlorin cobaltochelatase [Vibrio sp. KJ40-1]